MIKINISLDYIDFYQEKVIPIVMKNYSNNKFSFEIASTNRLIRNIALSLKKKNIAQFVRDVLLTDLNYLKEKYLWIEPYNNLVFFINFFKSKKNRKALVDYIYSNNDKCDVSSFIYLIDYDVLSNDSFTNLKFLTDNARNGQSNSSFSKDNIVSLVEDFFYESESVLLTVNNIFEKLFSYNCLKTNLRRFLYHLLNIPVCPYCNQQYTYYISDNRYLGDFDHLLPRSIFPLFSLSIWNLVPCCKPCNEVFKRKKILDILNPHDEGFDDDFGLHIYAHDVCSIVGKSCNFDIKFGCFFQKYSPSFTKRAYNNVNLFALNELYSHHKEMIRIVLNKKYLLSDLSLFRKCFLKSNNESLLYKYLLDNRNMYGVSLDKKEFQNELFSKIIYDIIFHN